MPEFATYSDLRTINEKLDVRALFKAASATRYGKNLFLSHSSKDTELLPAVIHILENHGASVYVDDGDQRLPETPSAETAQMLRSAIQECPCFVVFVTTNSKDSKWIPWELGLGDGYKKPPHVALFPTATGATEQAWAEREYLGLYRRIVWGTIIGWSKPGWMVYDHHSKTADGLAEWIRA